MRQTLLLMPFLLFSCQIKRQEAIHFPKGGYAYVKDPPSEAINFYHYPLKDVISKKDSLRAAFYDAEYYPAFDEPNISLHPPKKAIIRFVYESSFIGYSAIVTLIEGKITVKEKVTGYPYTFFPDMANLDSMEAWHLNLLFTRYPLYEYKNEPNRKGYNDSLLKRFPRLNDPHYFLLLMNKAKKRPKEPFTYRKSGQLRCTKRSIENFWIQSTVLIFGI
jgi:hypothetical protein